MNPGEKKTEKYRRCNPQFRLQCRSRTTSCEGLCFEEITTWSHSLERLLSSKCGMKIFQAFLKSEFSDENLEFWLVCEDFKMIRSSFIRTNRARKIFKCYIQAESSREINIDHKTREIIRQNIRVPSPVCFDTAQKIVYSLMERDSYPRFLRSDFYKALLDSVSETTQM